MRLALWGAVAFILLLGVIGAIDSFSTAYYAKVTTETTTTTATVTESYTETQSTTYTETYSTTYTESSTETVTETERSTETVTAAPQPYPNIVLILLLSIIMMISGLYVVVSRSK